jgi:ATP-binding cassette subfamily B (MDR/TAP) protein 1
MIKTLTYLQYGIGTTARSDANMQAIVFLILAVASLVFGLIQTWLFTLVGDRLTKRIRSDCYRKILKMPVSWFDIPKNNAGSLTSRLAADCQLVNGLSSDLIGTAIQTISCLVTGIAIAFAY